MNKDLHYLYSLERFGMKLGLGIIKQLMVVLGNPHQSFKSIHIAGTNGKGSTAAFIASVLQRSGYKVGLYTSPHLVRFNERIQVNAREISNPELVLLIAEIRNKLKRKRLQPTFFEFTTALAFLYFTREKVDFAVIEVGMGGRWDATNVLTPLVSVITNIEYDHMAHLGDTKLKIAQEKAGIIKEHIPVVVGEKDTRILNYFNKVCVISQSRFYPVRRLLTVHARKSSFSVQEFETKGEVNSKYKIALLGKHQLDNAGTALITILVLRQQGLKVSDAALREGLLSARWPGRLEVVSRHPLILIDGAHNVAGMAALRAFVQKISYKKVLVLGIAKDKEYRKMIHLIAPWFKIIIITQGNFKPQETGILAKEARKYCREVYEILSVKEALLFSRKKINRSECMLITGSLYMIGDALSVLRK